MIQAIFHHISQRITSGSRKTLKQSGVYEFPRLRLSSSLVQKILLAQLHEVYESMTPSLGKTLIVTAQLSRSSVQNECGFSPFPQASCLLSQHLWAVYIVCHHLLSITTKLPYVTCFRNLLYYTTAHPPSGATENAQRHRQLSVTVGEHP
jgi:hypothetical protein